MFRKRFFWEGVLMPGSLAGWIFAISGLFIGYEGVIGMCWLVVFLVWTIAHPLEIIVSYKIGKDRNLSFARTALKTVLFGFTWWLPLKMGVIDK